MDKTLQEISPTDAYEMMKADVSCLLIDIRSSMEFLFVGHPVGAVHVAWIDEPDWIINPHFVTEVRQLILGGAVCEEDKGCAPIILICRSGKRSKEAGEQLIQADLQNIYHIDEGFEGELDEHHQRSCTGGWRFRGLPWEQC